MCEKENKGTLRKKSEEEEEGVLNIKIKWKKLNKKKRKYKKY